jgi:hypothetical protein
MAGKPYGAMSREDFCDIVLSALRAGNLSDNEANLAVYAREWVISDAEANIRGMDGERTPHSNASSSSRMAASGPPGCCDLSNVIQ